MSALNEKTAESGSGSQDRPPQGESQGEVVNGINEKSDNQVSGDHQTTQDPQQQPSDANNEKQDEQNGPVQRRSTLKERIKDQKDKLKNKAKPPGGFDSTPLPDAPPGYTVKFTFHRASNLPAADFSTGASDPFLTATLTTSLPKRHKEDPDLVFRTRTLRKTLEPEWEQDWIVANVPPSGFRLKCRLYDEDWPDHDDRLGNVVIYVNSINENWEGFKPPGKEFEVKKRSGSKRAYLLKACTTAFTKDVSMTPKLYVSAVVLGQSDPPYGQMYTAGPTYYFKHFSPMIGRLTGTKVNRDEAEDSHDRDDGASSSNGNGKQSERGTQKYDFQANEIQLSGPVPSKLYHRFVEFRPVIGLLFKKSGLRGKILNKALHHQHARVYSFRDTTTWGTFEPCTEDATMRFLKLAHFDEGGRIFTYVLTLDGSFKFTETGKEFGIDLLSKHTMHSDAAIYIACSGEFFIRRLKKPHASEDPEPAEPSHPDQIVPGGPPMEPPPSKPQYYQLIIDNDSGTYRPDKSVLPYLQKFLERNFPGLGVVTLACDDPEDQKLKAAQAKVKTKEGQTINMVLNRSPSASSFSSDDISDLEDMDRHGDRGRKSKKERVWDLVEEPRRIKELRGKHTSNDASGGPSGSGEAS